MLKITAIFPKYRSSKSLGLSILGLLFTSMSFSAHAAEASDTPHATTMEQLAKVMPGASVIMLQMGERYKNLYWAGKLGKWEFAAYQTEEMEDLIHTLKITRPARAETADEFLKAVYPMISEAAASRDWPRFEKAFDELRGQCMSCHAKNDHSFVTLPIPKSANSPVLNMK
ncbi:MAG: hypothetical protein COB30_007665 [Ectothiorhodospiraceae bacterium]|nr:hypothetical protein [Ectothiorhodospiraceae bacterium]